MSSAGTRTLQTGAVFDCARRKVKILSSCSRDMLQELQSFVIATCASRSASHVCSLIIKIAYGKAFVINMLQGCHRRATCCRKFSFRRPLGTMFDFVQHGGSE